MGSVRHSTDMTGKVALVTGGSHGLGLQIAEALGPTQTIGYSTSKGAVVNFTRVTSFVTRTSWQARHPPCIAE